MKEFNLILVALFFSLHQVAIRKGTEKGDLNSGIFISLLTSSIIFLMLSVGRFYFDHTFLLVMAAAGILHFLVARTAFYHSIDRVGANIAGPLSATRMYFAVLFGAIFFQEEITVKILLMTTFIFTGVFLLSKPDSIRRDTVGILLGIATGLAASFSSVLVKAGMQIYGDAVWASAIGYTSSAILYAALMRSKALTVNRSHFYFALGGLLVGVGHYLRYDALMTVPVSVVEPVLSIYPLFTILLTYVFIRELESFSFRVIAGAVLIILGIEIYFFS
jgi:drug/metabolite transporter (DMT)-like permease